MELHEVTGSFGRWQMWVFVVLLYCNMVGMWQNLSITFFAPNVPFRCVEPQPQDRLNASTEILFDGSCTAPNGSSSTMWIPCTKFEYDKSLFSDTIVSEWDLVCDREWLVSLMKSVYMFGFLVSVVVFGQLSDCIGRFPAMLIAFFVNCLGMFLSLLSSSYTMFAVLRFLSAFGRTGFTTVGYVLLLEIIGPQHRTSTGLIVQLGWSVGFISLAAIAWFVRHWFWLQLVLSVAFLPFLFTLTKIPESPRWLLMQGKMEKLEKILAEAIKMNNRRIKGDLKDLDIFKKKTEEKETKTLLDVLKMPRMRLRTFNMMYLWMVNAFMYYGLTYNTNDLAGDPYLNFLIAGLLEFPSYGLLYWGIRRFGRRPTLLALMLGAGCACAAVAVAPQPGSDYAWVGTTLSMAGKFCVTASFGLLYLYTSELYPTVVRTVALGSCSMCARIGSISAPFVRELGRATHSSVPNILYGILALSSGILAFAFLPETAGCKLPDSLEEGEQFGRSLENGGKKEKCTNATLFAAPSVKKTNS